MIRTVARKLTRKYRYIYNKSLCRSGFNGNKRSGRETIKSEGLLFDESNRREIVRLYQKYFRRNLGGEQEMAENICNHEFTFLGHTIQHGKEIDWLLDPVSGKKWVGGFSQDIVFKGPNRLGDIKLVWELNKHQYLFILGKSYWVTGKEIFADEIIAQINSWIEKNPRHMGPNWISSLEVGMRVISWVMVYPFIQKNMSETFRSKFTHSLFEQLKFIEQNLSYSPFANTHLIGEASSLVVGGLFLESPRSRKWLSCGMKILAEEIGKQVFDDGVHKEQSLNYQRFFLDYYYLIMILFRKNKLTYDKKIDLMAEKMTEFVAYALKPDGSAPSFGDADDARGLYVKSDCIHDYKGTLSLGAVLFNRGDFKYAAGELSEEVLWLLGQDGVRRFLELKGVPPETTSRAYEKGGYYIMRTGWERDASYSIFDCGPLGHGPAGHGHADALSFQLSCGGVNYLIDPGTYSYNLDYGWRDYFRSTKAHNTITVDQLSQSEIRDRMSWQTFVRSQCTLWLSTNEFDFVDIEHDGYQRLNDPVAHRRIALFDRKERWILVDLLQSQGAHIYDYHLHVDPDCLVAPFSDDRVEIFSHGHKKIMVHFLKGMSAEQKVEIFRCDEGTRLGWVSGQYGSKKPTNTVRVRRKAQGNTQYVTLVDGASSDCRISIEDYAPLKLLIYQPSTMEEELLIYSLAFLKGTVMNGISFTGRFCYVKKKADRVYFSCAKDFTSFDSPGYAISSKSQIQSLRLLENIVEVTVPENNIKDLKIAGENIGRLLINGRLYDNLIERSLCKKQ